MLGPRPSTPSGTERLIKERLAGHRLVCEVAWEPELLDWVRWDWQGLRNGAGKAGVSKFVHSYRLVNLLFMVQWGLRKYGHNQFWTELKLSAGEQRAVGESFEAALAEHDLEDFPQFAEERAKRFVSVILAHGGIPATDAADFLRKALLPALASGAASSADELIALWRADPPASFRMPVRRFLFHGGATAVDLLDRLITMVGTPREDLRADQSAGGVPAHLVKAFLEVPESEVSRAGRWPRPAVVFRPYEGTGPQLFLPPLSRELAQGFSWEVEDGSGETVSRRGFFRQDVPPMALLPAGFWKVTARRDGEARLWVRECFGEEPVVCFDEEGNYLPDAGGVRGDSVWIIAPDGADLASLEDGARRPLTGEPGSSLPAAWRGYQAARYDLRGVHLLSIIGPGHEEARLPVLRSQAGAELVSQPVRDACSVEGEDVLGELPRIVLPAGSDWTVAVSGPDGRAERTYAASPEPRSIELSSIVAASLGRYEVQVRGLLGQDMVPTAFALVPGLALDTPHDPLLPGQGSITVTARAAGGIGLGTWPPRGPAELTLEPDEDHEELWAWEHKRKQGVLVSVPRLRWAFRAAEQMPVFDDTPLALEPSQELPEALLVNAGRANVALVVHMVDLRGTQLQMIERKVTDAAGRAVFDLTLARTTAQMSGTDGFRLNLLVNERSVTLLERAAEAKMAATGLPRLGERVEAKITNIGRSGLDVRGEGWRGHVRAERLLRPVVSYRVGDSLRATVIRIDGPDHVQLEGRPFDPKRFRLGQEVTGWVVRVFDNSLLVDVEGHDARVGAERLPRGRPVESWQVGMSVTGRIVEVNPRARILRLAVAPFPRDRFAPGRRVKGTVTAATDGGLIVDLGGVVGFVPADDEGPGPRPRMRSQIEAWVQRADPRREEFVLSMRPFNEHGLRLGDTLDVRVAKPLPNVVLVALPYGGIAGIPRQHMLAQFNGADDQPPAGTVLAAKVIGLDAAQRRITLSATAATPVSTFGATDVVSPFAVLRQPSRGDRSE